jgi:DNA-binding NtrC family response regulator
MSPLKSKSLNLLIVDDDASIRTLLETRLSRKGHSVFLAADVAQAKELLSKQNLDVVVTDLRMPGESGFELLVNNSVPTIIITGHGDKESAIRAVEQGAFGFFEKPFDLDSLEVSILRAAEKHALESERINLLQELGRLCQMQNRQIQTLEMPKPTESLGSNDSVLEIKKYLEKLSLKPTATVLIGGESGSGKEVFARELHVRTHKQFDKTPFVALNCSAIPADLLESELFGHEKGAFSGAHSSKFGLAEVAQDGTLFLDEIGDMDLRHQSKLLRLLQERQFRRVGGVRDLPFKGRIVAATHKNLSELIAEGLFREDLYYRLSVIEIRVPSLRERGDDVFDIAQSLCEKFKLRGIAPERWPDVRAYRWPGNIRELHNWIERAAILGLVDESGFVTAPLAISQENVLEPRLQLVDGLKNGFENSTKKDLKKARAQVLEQIDREYMQRALNSASGNLSEAARLLGLDRKNLTRRLAELGIHTKSKKLAS